MSFSWQEYRDLIVVTHLQLRAPVVWRWDNLSVHELNPQEGVWSLLKRQVANFVATDLAGLTRIVKRKLKKIQYRPELIDGCLAGTGLTLDTPQIE